MLSRSPGMPAAALAVLMIAGCLHPVTEKVDSTVCTIAARPHDVDPDSARSDPAPVATPAGTSQSSSDPLTPVEYSQTTSPPPASAQNAPTQPGSGAPPAARAAPDRLTIPPGLPGANAPPIALPPLSPENEGKRRQAIANLYAPLDDLGPDPRPFSSPDGHPLTLADLQRLGMSNSPLLRQAAASVEAARGAAIQAGAYPNPQIGFEQDTINTAGGPAYLGGFFDQKIIMGNKLQLARAAATMDLKNAELALRRAETDLMAKIRSGYYAVLVAREYERVSRELAKFTGDIYQIQVDQVNKGGIAAPYEPLQLRALAVQARAALISARNRYTSAWKQLASSLGLPGMPPTELAGNVDAPLPIFDHEFVLDFALHHHTDVLTAENTFIKSQYNLKLARQTVVPDVDIRLMVQKDYTGTPFNMDPSIQVYFPLPVWDRNQGGIIQAQGNAVNASEEAHRVRSDLTTRLADAYERYNTNRVLLQYYRDQILPDLVRAYRGLYQRYQTEMAPGVALPGAIGPPAAVSAPPAFADVVVGQQNLSNAVIIYIQTLGQAWQAVVDVADVLQTDDIYRVGDHVFPTECPAPLPEIGGLPPLPCAHPCSPLPDPSLKGSDGNWPAADRNKEPKSPAPIRETKSPSPAKLEPAKLPALAGAARLMPAPVATTTRSSTQPVAMAEDLPAADTSSKLLEPPPDLPKH